jgi:hypothetical protein
LLAKGSDVFHPGVPPMKRARLVTLESP